jgi:pimeloyl-ACP methyl ester carboxylesterase
MSTITTKDGTEIYYKDWGAGPVITFSHGWPLSSDAWDGQMMFLAQNGFRAVAHDRRGHGRSSQASAWNAEKQRPVSGGKHHADSEGAKRPGFPRYVRDIVRSVFRF